ncbi:PREDICTED: golgin subfamily A member 4 [Ceratosolen solmsi marchali]|uniref:Golgin subfamily A member 4 n=1 Tax=Ceratosolen solmsi marchali TaxID=326594 RepID=A0AAJ6YS80_9HYME|nr:PREDICTED: golgin subfamily A member 4 [Ceratosolen solmsi marchali]
MEDIDDLDSALFDKNSRTAELNDTKKRVVFKDFSKSIAPEDFNPLDDSFKESLKKKSGNIDRNSKVVNLFGIKHEDRFEMKDSDSIETLLKSPLLAIKNSLEKPQSDESVLKESDFVRLSATNQAKKSSLIDDLFGGKLSTSVVDTTKINFNVSAARSYPREAITGISNENTNNASTESGFSLSASKGSRRGRRTSTIFNDPLGLFSISNSRIDESSKVEEKTNQQLIVENNLKSVEFEKLPEWLRDPKVIKEQKHDIVETGQSEELPKVKFAKTDKVSNSTNIQNIALDKNMDQNGLTSKLLSIEFDQQAAIMHMQQQEHELRIGTALSQQTEKFNYLLETQKIKSIDQEKQFNMLLARQLERQSILEAQMKSQQDRIDNYIQTLTAQPTIIPSMNFTTNNDMKQNTKTTVDEKIVSENLLQKFEMEKIYLENIVENLKEKHEKEISILEDSYKKQLTFLEEAMVQMEKRMQDEVECLEADYKLKIQKLKEEILELEKVHKIEKEILKEDNSTILQDIRENHLKNLEIIHKEHVQSIQRIIESKESEHKAIEIMTIDGANIEKVINKSQIIIENLEHLHNRLENKDKNFTEFKSNHLLNQEKNIEYLKGLLEKQKDIFTEEKQKLMVTIQKLELDSFELLKEFKKQNTVFIENQEILKSKENALLRDREIFIEQNKWERERLQMMRDEWVKEQDKQFGWLAQERQTLITEKGKLKILNRLKIGSDDVSKIELEATIKAAQNAVSNANREKLKWQEKINELEVQKNNLQEKENALIQKAKELQIFTQSALAKREEGLRALNEARLIEECYKDKLSKIQAQQEILLQRENKLANEKFELARDRLSFHVSHDIEKPVKDTVCKLDSKISHEDQLDISNLLCSRKNITLCKDIVDPHLVMLKWKLDNKSDNSKKLPFVNSH